MRVDRKKTPVIKDLPLMLRPREKLLIKGTENLSNEELLALLLSTGSRTHNALTLAEAFLKQFPVETIANHSFSTLRIPGIGKAKLTRILAAIELGKRLFSPELLENVTILSTQDAISQVKDITNKKQEHLIALYLNARHELIHKQLIGLGTLNTLLIEPKEIFIPALTSPCDGIILIHNHPSNNPSPSAEDITFTKRLEEAATIMGITFIDHIIVTSSSFFSFRSNEIDL